MRFEIVICKLVQLGRVLNLLFGKGLRMNPLTDNQIIALSKFKAFADRKLNVTQSCKFVFHTIENIFGSGKNAGY